MNMKTHYYIVLCILYVDGMLASGSNVTLSGCNLIVPDAVKGHQEPEGRPLKISIDISVQQVRDVPDSGGSFGVDFQ